MGNVHLSAARVDRFCRIVLTRAARSSSTSWGMTMAPERPGAAKAFVSPSAVSHACKSTTS